jgi:hypothetical protein
MYYATHCIGPVLALTREEAESVSCFGSGTIRKAWQQHYHSPFAVESAHIKCRNSDLSAHVYRSLFDTARQYRESFEVYGAKRSVEWPLIEGRPLVVHTAKKPEKEIPGELYAPDYAHLLPQGIQHFTKQGVYDEEGNQHLSFSQGSGHGGSHPHLVHAFISALMGESEPYPNAKQSANITCVGILAHESALKGGEILRLPSFTFC